MYTRRLATVLGPLRLFVEAATTVRLGYVADLRIPRPNVQ